jgi:UrcA family protein
MRFSVSVAVAAFLVSVAGQAAAADTIGAERLAVLKRVPVAAIDFRSAGQVEGLYATLQRAALQVCVSPDVGFADSALRAADRACAQRALGTAVASINRPMLTARFQRQDAPILARGY